MDKWMETAILIIFMLTTSLIGTAILNWIIMMIEKYTHKSLTEILLPWMEEEP